MIRRDIQVAVRHALTHGIGLDTDGSHQVGIGVAGQVEAAMTDPFDRPRRPIHRHHIVADGQTFDGDFPAIGEDMRAGAEAGGQRDLRVVVRVIGNKERITGS